MESQVVKMEKVENREGAPPSLTNSIQMRGEQGEGDGGG
jgi:hypothetical protein